MSDNEDSTGAMKDNGGESDHSKISTSSVEANKSGVDVEAALRQQKKVSYF